jgi:hypothetical protein
MSWCTIVTMELVEKEQGSSTCAQAEIARQNIRITEFILLIAK